MVLDDLGEGILVVDTRHPPWKLRVPDKGVSSEQLATAGGPVRDLVSVAEVKLAPVCYSMRRSSVEDVSRAGAALTFRGVPLHGILSGDGTEL